jgi:hypothetical protein
MGSRTTTFHGYKTRVGYGTFGATPTSLAAATYLGELKSVDRNGQQVAKLDVTHLESPAGYKEMIPGFGEGGTFDLNFNYHPLLERTLDSLSPDPGYQPVAGGGAVGDPSAYGRRLIYLSDRYLNFQYANAIWDPPSRSVGEDGVQTNKVTVTVAEGRPMYVAAAGAAANPGTYTAPT